jgi:hypothetical protein
MVWVQSLNTFPNIIERVFEASFLSNTQKKYIFKANELNTKISIYLADISIIFTQIAELVTTKKLKI